MAVTRFVGQSPAGELVYRFLWFGGGLLAGLMLFFALLLFAVEARNDGLAGDVQLATSGGDISAAGGVGLAIRRETGVIIQTCNGRCDDLRVTNLGRSNSLKDVRVLDSHGDCIACIKRDARVRSGRRDDWKITGAAPLRIRWSDRPVSGND